MGMAIRNLPRTMALAAALLFCCVVFLRQQRRSRSWAAAITAIFCFSYAVDQLLYATTFADLLLRRSGLHISASFAALASVEVSNGPRLLFLDVVNTFGICLGMILLLVETHQKAEDDLEESHRRNVGLAVDNVALQAEIRERQRVEEALRESERRYRELIEASEDLLCTHDLEGRLLSVNPAPARKLGYEVNELLQLTLPQLLAPKYHQEFSAFIARLREFGQDKGIVKVLTRSGERRIWEYHSTLRQEQGAAPLVFGIAHDVTDRVHAEQALRQSEAKFRLVAETAACCIWIMQEGRMVYLSPQVEVITGYSREEILAMNPWELVHPEYRPILEARIKANPEEAQLLSHFQYKIMNRSGEERWIEVTDSRLQFNGKPAILATALDITAAKRAQEEIKEHALYLDSLIFNSPLGIVVKDEKLHVRFCNSAFERMFLYSQAELVGKDLDEIIAPHDREAAAQLTRSGLSGKVVHATAQRRRKDGSAIDVELHGLQLYSGSTLVGAYAFYQDITERRRSEEKLQALRSRLTRAQEEERARIARDLHDDAGQRLALLSIDLEQLKQASLKTKSNFSQQLESLVKMASEITSDVHNVSRRLHPSQVELLGLGTALGNFCREFAARNAMDIQFVQSGVLSKPPQDAALCLFLVAQEAIRNVHKHSGCLQASVELAEKDGALVLRVSDRGKGFDPEALDANQGLGLLSMEERLHSMGGVLSIHSLPGGGTCIEANLPVVSVTVGAPTNGST